MSEFSRAEVDEAFRNYWQTGNIEERWADWTGHFTEDVVYVEHVLGTMKGRETVKTWITELMVTNDHVHGSLDWYVIDGPRVAYGMQNVYFDPRGPGHPDIEFPGMSQVIYAGEGLFSFEEDYWDLRRAKAAHAEFHALREEHGDEHLADNDERRASRKLW